MRWMSPLINCVIPRVAQLHDLVPRRGGKTFDDARCAAP